MHQDYGKKHYPKVQLVPTRDVGHRLSGVQYEWCRDRPDCAYYVIGSGCCGNPDCEIDDMCPLEARCGSYRRRGSAMITWVSL